MILRPLAHPPGRDVMMVAVLLVLAWSINAQAYIDPGTGSVAYQLFVTAILAAAYSVRRLVQRWLARETSRDRPGHSSNRPDGFAGS